MNRWFAFLAGAVSGAAAMYLMDPNRGYPRRSRIRRAVRGFRRPRPVPISPWVPVPDDVLVDRVRARLGHVLRRMDHIEVAVADGRVTLMGAVWYDEVDRAVRCVASVPGVREVVDRLSVREDERYYLKGTV